MDMPCAEPSLAQPSGALSQQSLLAAVSPILRGLQENAGAYPA